MSKDRLILKDKDYVKVYENCPFRKGRIIILQVSKSKWDSPKYDKYR